MAILKQRRTQKAECFPAVFRKQLQAALKKAHFTQRHLPRLPGTLPGKCVERTNERTTLQTQSLELQHQMIFRQFVSDVEVITLDGNGRFLIPKRYLKLAKIQQDVRFIGLDDTIEIWAKERSRQTLHHPTGGLWKRIGRNYGN